MNQKREFRRLFMKHEYHIVYTPIEDGWIMATAPNCRAP